MPIFRFYFDSDTVAMSIPISIPISISMSISISILMPVLIPMPIPAPDSIQSDADLSIVFPIPIISRDYADFDFKSDHGSSWLLFRF